MLNTELFFFFFFFFVCFFFPQDKEVAINIKKLPVGTVVFEDTSEKEYTGTITKTIPRFSTKKTSEPFPGKLIYDTDDGG